MAALGYRKDRKGFFIWNSWGPSWVSGPAGPGDPPEGGFWCDWQTFDRMCRQGDTWAFSDAQGFPARKLDWFVLAPQPPRRDTYAQLDGPGRPRLALPVRRRG
jgi:hypothetical protein